MYEYLNCLQVSPCAGWMSDDKKLREFTSERAYNLSRVAEDIVNTKTYNNFDMLYYDYAIEGRYQYRDGIIFFAKKTENVNELNVAQKFELRLYQIQLWYFQFGSSAPKK